MQNLRSRFRSGSFLIILALLLGTTCTLLGGTLAIRGYAWLLTRAGSWPITTTPADIGLAYEEVSLTTADGLKISGWYIPGRTPHAIVLVHGIWANKQAIMPAAVMLAEAGYHVLSIDLRGHGHSQGDTVSYGYYEALDVEAAVDFLAANPSVKKVGVMGYSLGGAAVVKAAAGDERIQALVIESSFSSLREAIRGSFSRFTHLPSWPFAPLMVEAAEEELGIKAEQVDSARDLASMPPRPVMIIHGSADDLFPVSHAYQLYEAAPGPKELWIIEGLRHDYPLDHKAEYRERVLGFFAEAFGQVQ